jgi:polyphosphate glucokinase
VSTPGHHIGIDIGGTTIKYATVDTATGTLTTPLSHVPTPVPATPAAVADTLTEVLEDPAGGAQAPLPEAGLGVAVPAIVRDGITCSAANIDLAWIDLDVQQFLTDRLDRTTHVLNDADAAGLAEARHGAGRTSVGRALPGTVLVITLGTGIGSALIVNGRLVPNLELGHLEIDGFDAETRASALAREREGLDWTAYAERLQRYFSHLEFLLSPDLIIVGGGISACHPEFLPHLQLRTRIIPAQLRNAAGIIGAARHATLMTASAH